MAGLTIAPPPPEDTQDRIESKIISALQSDLRLLQNGKHSDFIIQCGQRIWRVHKFVLERCPYFKALLDCQSLWGQGLEGSKSVIEQFEADEMNWLIQFTYCPVIDAQKLAEDLPSKSVLELCVRLWTTGDHFRFTLLTDTAMKELNSHCRAHFAASTHYSNVCYGMPFINELEAAIKAARAPDSIDGPFRKPLLRLFMGVRRYLHKTPSCAELLKQTPDFALAFALAALRLDAPPLADTSLVDLICHGCGKHVGIFEDNKDAEDWDGARVLPGSVPSNWNEDFAVCSACAPDFGETNLQTAFAGAVEEHFS